MAVNLSPIWGAGAQLLDNSGNVLSGGKIYTYAAGTTTQVATYTSNSGITANSNPIVLNSAGRVPYEIWLTDGQNYKFVLKDSNDVLIGTWDNLSGINSNFIAYTNQQEIQTATANQTVFNLTTMNYLVGTNSLSVFVDGVNQYGPGAQYAYEETDSNTVTFASGLHVGAEVKFTSTQTQNAGVVDASQVGYTPAGTDAVSTNVQAKLRQYVSVKDFGAIGDGSADDTDALKNAFAYIESVGGGSLFFPNGTYNVYNPNGETFAALDGMTNFAIVGAATVHNITTYTTGQQAVFLDITNTKNIHIDTTMKFVSQLYVSDLVGDTNTTNLSWFKINAGSEYVTGGANFVGGLHGFWFYHIGFNPYGTQPTDIPGKATLVINASNVYYPLLCENGGDYVNAEINAHGCGRNFYGFGGAHFSNIRVTSKNQVGASGLSSNSYGRGTSNCKIDFFDRYSDLNYATNSRLLLQYYVTTPTIFENIEYKVDVYNPQSSPFKETLVVSKLNGSGGADTVGRGHILRNFSFNGVSQQVDNRAHLTMIGAFASTDSVETVTIGPLNATNPGYTSNIEMTVGDALANTIAFNQVYLPNGYIHVTHTTGKSIFNDCYVNEANINSSDTTPQDYYSTTVTSSGSQSYINKNFFQSKLGSYYLTSYDGNYRKQVTSLANGSVVSLTPPNSATADVQGQITIIASGGVVGVFNLNGANHTTQEVSDASNAYSITKGNASTTNVYWDATNLRYELQNNTGGSDNYEFVLIYKAYP